jgi:hypothetical protein
MGHNLYRYDEDEAKFVASEKIRLAKEAEQRAKERLAEEGRRAVVGRCKLNPLDT